MKRSRRVVLTLMGSAAVGAVSMGFVPLRGCGPGEEAIPGVGGRPYCRAITAASAARCIISMAMAMATATAWRLTSADAAHRLPRTR